MNVYNYADIFIEGAFRAVECRLAQMNVFSHYCLTFSADDCLFSLNDIQKVYMSHLYNNQISARALIGQSALGYCAGKPTEKSRVFLITI